MCAPDKVNGKTKASLKYVLYIFHDSKYFLFNQHIFVNMSKYSIHNPSYADDDTGKERREVSGDKVR